MSTRKAGLSDALGRSESGDSTKSGDSVTAAGVASLASRFAQSNSVGEKDTAKVSDKVSNLAGRFGSIVDKDAPMPFMTAAPKGGKYRAAAAAAKAAKAAEEDARVVAELPVKVGDVAKKFAHTKEKPSPDHDHDATPAFASAADHFRRAEQDHLRPAESRVSAFAKRIESGSATTFDSPAGVERKVAGVARTFESKSAGQPPQPERSKHSAPASGVSNSATVLARSTFDAAGDKDKDKQKQRPIRERAPGVTVREDEQDDQRQMESSESRFASATKLFESGRANPERQLDKATASADVGGGESQTSAQSRFADAARVFGGS